MNYSFRRILKYKITATSYAMCIQYMHVITHCRLLWLDYTRQLLCLLLCKPANRCSVCLLAYNVSCCAIPPMIVTQEWSLVRYSYRDLEATTRPPLCVCDPSLLIYTVDADCLKLFSFVFYKIPDLLFRGWGSPWDVFHKSLGQLIKALVKSKLQKPIYQPSVITVLRYLDVYGRARSNLCWNALKL